MKVEKKIKNQKKPRIYDNINKLEKYLDKSSKREKEPNYWKQRWKRILQQTLVKFRESSGISKRKKNPIPAN